MCMNTSHNISPWCFSPNYLTFSNTSKYISYFVLMPFYTFLGISGQIVCFLAFRTQHKNDISFGYQSRVALAKLMEPITFALFSLTCKWWSDIDGTGELWYMRKYSLTWISAHLSIPIMNLAYTTSLFLSIAMATDRLYALSKPFKFKQLNHKKRQNLAVIFSILVAFIINLAEFGRFCVSIKDDRFVRKVNEDFVRTKFARIFSTLKTIGRVFSVLALLVINVAIVRLYRIRVVTKFGTFTYADKQKEENRRQKEKTLTVLTFVQCTVTWYAVLPLTVYYAIAFFRPEFGTCPGPLVATISDAILEMAEMTNFVFLFIFSKQFRSMVKSIFNNV